ncbi:MAG: segregation/condensation protein A [Rhodospirillales bacterium]|nr:segregation/condensation protein A [Rhodospirillales bacterium]
MGETQPFEDDPRRETADDGALFVDLGSYEGPIDVLLALARDQKVDLTRISILALADQYLAFIAHARNLRLEIAADYLVMAAWLAFLKSRLLLPAPPEDEAATPSASEMAAALAFQLRRLQAMQDAGARLMARAQLGREVFPRGAPEGIRVVARPVYEVSLYELLKGYGEHKSRGRGGVLEIAPTELYSMEMALERLSTMLGRMPEWTTLQSFLPSDIADGLIGRSALAAMLSAGLELVRTGRMQLRQDATFGPIYIRKAPDNPVAELPRPEPSPR